MNYPDYVSNLQTGYSNFVSNPASAMQPLMSAVSGMAAPAASGYQPQYQAQYQPHHRHHHHHDLHGCGCGCHEHHHHHDECGCHCCIRCADLVEYARCGEIRRIPITFDNDTRRERDVTLTLGGFTTEGGQSVAWKAAVSPATFKLAPCGETTVLLSVLVDCSALAGTPPTTPTPPGTATPPTTATPPANTETLDIGGLAAELSSQVSHCKVAYATLEAKGCAVRPLIVAVAVLPSHCGAHHSGCGCGCCN